MQNANLLLMIEAIANEKNISLDDVFCILEESLAIATKRKQNINYRVSIDRKTGDFKTFRRWEVVDDDESLIGENKIPFNEELHIDHSKANGLDIGDFVEEEVESIEFGRIAAQTVKQLINQKVRNVEKAAIIDTFKKQVGNIIITTVKRVDRGNVYVDLGGIDGVISKNDLIPNESMRKGDRIRAYLKEVKPEQRGIQIFLSRSAPDFLIELFKMEVPEIGSDIIEIKGGARDPGLRSKLAVNAKDKRIDPVGSCIGMRGSRVQAVSNELNGERIDVILWDDNAAQFVINAMAPAEISSITVYEDIHSMDVVVEDEQLAQAIGKGGQNVRLASQVTGWRLNVMSNQQAEEKQKGENVKIYEKLSESLFVDEEIINKLINEDYSSLEELSKATEEELLKIEGFNQEIVDELQENIQDAMLAKALNDDTSIENLLDIKDIDEKLATKLVNKGITSQEDVADLGVDELLEIHNMDREIAEKLIMAAREAEGWFK
ncbi:Transcription termination protein NusA [hydrothermal vent metagenome]|uniref:Transcription termination protein NusA n=1 Tax=hydrothermal vent metagenome TaxID=652676 RepID=A0A1W1CJ83_9ZZZZ